MINPTADVTAGMLRLALDAASLNHQVISNNIANANTPGFHPARLQFDAQLSALREELRAGAPVDGSQLHALVPSVARPAAAPASDAAAALDLEMTELAQNTLHYEALLRVLGKHFALMSSAINEGKR